MALYDSEAEKDTLAVSAVPKDRPADSKTAEIRVSMNKENRCKH